MDLNLTYNIDRLIAGSSVVEHLPEWARIESIYNCEKTWILKESFLAKFIKSIFGK